LLQSPDAVSQVGGLLESHLGGESLHFIPKKLDQLLRVPVEQFLYLLDGAVVILLRLVPHARCRALLNVILEARLVLACGDGIWREIQIAGSQLEDRSDRVKHKLHVLHVRIRPDVGRPILPQIARREDSREAFVLDADVRVALVVAQIDVVARLELLDEIILEDQRLRLGVGHDDLDIRDLVDHHGEAAIARPALVEIGAHPAAKVLGLADVDHLAVGVQMLVHARLAGQGAELFFERRIHTTRDGMTPEVNVFLEAIVRSTIASLLPNSAASTRLLEGQMGWMADGSEAGRYNERILDTLSTRDSLRSPRCDGMGGVKLPHGGDGCSDRSRGAAGRCRSSGWAVSGNRLPSVVVAGRVEELRPRRVRRNLLLLRGNRFDR